MKSKYPQTKVYVYHYKTRDEFTGEVIKNKITVFAKSKKKGLQKIKENNLINGLDVKIASGPLDGVLKAEITKIERK